MIILFVVRILMLILGLIPVILTAILNGLGFNDFAMGQLPFGIDDLLVTTFGYLNSIATTIPPLGTLLLFFYYLLLWKIVWKVTSLIPWLGRITRHNNV